MQAVLAQMDLENALLGIDKMPSTLTAEEKKRKDRKDMMKEKTTAALWKRLEQICMSKTLTSKLHMKQRLYAHRLEEGASVHEHLTVFKEILSNLEAMEGESLITRGRQDRNAGNDRRRKQERNPRGKSKGRTKSLNRGKTCNFYKKKGHIKFECYKLQNKIKREAANQKGKQQENSGEADVVEDYSDGELLIAFVNDSKVTEEWILDSGSVGTIKVKIFDGVVRTLSDVRHVPKLKRNLISLSIIDSKGYRYTAESGVLKISKGSLVVMKGQRKTAKLYVLQGSTVTGNAAVTSSSLSDDDITKLWHMRLGHMSENDMIVQVRRDRETLASSSYSTVIRHCRTNEQNDHGESSMYVVKCQLTEVVLGRSNLYCMFLINRSSSVAIEKKTPQEVWSAGVKGYKLWCPENRKVVISKDVVFDEIAMLPNLSLKDSSNKENQKQVEHQINTESTPQASTKIENRVASSPQYSIAKNQTRREIKPSKKYTEADLVAYALNMAEDINANREPSNYSEAITVKTQKSGCKKIVHCKWVFKKKEGTPGVEESRYKARLVAKGYSQIPGVDFTDVFSLVVKHSSIRVLLGIVTIHDLELEQLDVKTAFLHGELEEDIYMQQPEGFTVLEKEDYVCLLKKSFYDLK
ncbi:hypothetical protein CXB51_003524 [Gossypium anomalum]|uniref:Reverse transcriptase Ty1/copia-type domain-containing protein n=1 Tax=Gossypium anomalum TaxID=47600 RepID=A0A8J6A0G6_9ROSI|nr:hypothetical protein CXB51_003524 [Gossypium anomalum]